MAKTRKTRKTAAAQKPVVDVVTQLVIAWQHRSATAIGAVAGGSIPWLAKVLAHEELPAAWRAGSFAAAAAILAVIFGCAAFSMLTVARFGMAAFGDKRKAIGFVIALEGVMLVAHGTASAYALLLLIAVNAITNGCHIALGRAATLRRQASDAKRQATAAQTRARKNGSAPASAPSIPTPTATAPVVAPGAVVWMPRTAPTAAETVEFRMIA